MNETVLLKLAIFLIFLTSDERSYVKCIQLCGIALTLCSWSVFSGECMWWRCHMSDAMSHVARLMVTQ